VGSRTSPRWVVRLDDVLVATTPVRYIDRVTLGDSAVLV